MKQQMTPQYLNMMENIRSTRRYKFLGQMKHEGCNCHFCLRKQVDLSKEGWVRQANHNNIQTMRFLKKMLTKSRRRLPFDME